ncbi:hypothetical protein BSL78_16348 [Apostichopus japonicus]|uniref:TIR domain-containing protein n=2 Tax=Stichopus japonicus TaxID=307972 RepID=A0A2G8KFM3_STIJA|nr:hypothetical protein BSL78_16348 [Apostichopus japonicus]
MHDEPKAVDLGLHLNFHGFEVILDNPASLSEQERKRKCKSIFKKASAVVVVYSSYYRQEILAKPKQNKRNTRYIYSLMKEEHEKKGGNLRSVFYPMYKVQTGNKIPRIFNNLPQHQTAKDVHGLLFRQVQPPGSA